MEEQKRIRLKLRLRLSLRFMLRSICGSIGKKKEHYYWSWWRLPKWMYPDIKKPTHSSHEKMSRYIMEDKSCLQ